MKQVLLDTDTISYFFRNESNVVRKMSSHLELFGFVNFSVVTYYEILNGLYFKDAKRQLKVFERFAELNQIIPLTDLAAKRAARIYSGLRKKGLSVGHNDVMIAAVALENDLVLVSNNIRHFEHIEGLLKENWMEG